jgi:hypothetical protein
MMVLDVSTKVKPLQGLIMRVNLIERIPRGLPRGG